MEVAYAPNSLLLELPDGWYLHPPSQDVDAFADAEAALAMQRQRTSSVRITHFALHLTASTPVPTGLHPDIDRRPGADNLQPARILILIPVWKLTLTSTLASLQTLFRGPIAVWPGYLSHIRMHSSRLRHNSSAYTLHTRKQGVG